MMLPALLRTLAGIGITTASLAGVALAATDTHLGVTVQDLVTLRATCEAADPGEEIGPYQRLLLDGTITGTFAVPVDQVLVITDVGLILRDFAAPPVHRGFVIIAAPAGAPFAQWQHLYRQDVVTGVDGFAQGHDHLTAAVVIPSGYIFDTDAAGDRVVASFGTPVPDFCAVHLRGYLKPAKSR